MFVEVPNSENTLLTLYNSDSFQHFTYWCQYLFLFYTDTLMRLAEQAGLRIGSPSITNVRFAQITCIGSAKTNQVAVRNRLSWKAQN
jgi:hypothetical protein